jgi:hypothetical protein
LLEVVNRGSNVILAKEAITKIASNAKCYDARPNPGFSFHLPIGCRHEEGRDCLQGEQESKELTMAKKQPLT